jgi:hypothetical protein
MRLFLIWAGRKSLLELGDLILKLNKSPHELVYWVGVPEGEKFKPKNTIFHSYDDAMLALPAKGVDMDQFAPPGADIISRMYQAESIVLTMMNRMFGGFCVDERRHIYYKMIQYWFGALKKYKPELIIFPNTPHFVYNYVIYELARILNIRTIMFDDTRIPGRLLFYSDFRKGSDVLRERILANKEKKFTLNDLSVDIRNYYKPRTSSDYNTQPDYIIDQKKKYSAIYWLLREPKIWKSIKDFTILIKAPRYIFRRLRQKNIFVIKNLLVWLSYFFRNNLKKEYIGAQSRLNLDKNFIYMPLQKQPERTTSPQGDMFVDQILALEILSASLPEDWKIYVKEHPLQWMDLGYGFSSSRYRGYYQRIADIKNVELVPVDGSSYALINRSRCVAAVTGSAGWEAIMRSKPAIIFGHVWYYDCPGIFLADGVPSCAGALQKIAGGFAVNQQLIINFLKSFDEATIHGFIAATAARASGLTGKESMNNIAQLLLKEMEKF